jgi:hypothetical protein
MLYIVDQDCDSACHLKNYSFVITYLLEDKQGVDDVHLACLGFGWERRVERVGGRLGGINVKGFTAYATLASKSGRWPMGENLPPKFPMPWPIRKP